MVIAKKLSVVSVALGLAMGSLVLGAGQAAAADPCAKVNAAQNIYCPKIINQSRDIKSFRIDGGSCLNGRNVWPGKTGYWPNMGVKFTLPAPPLTSYRGESCEG